MNLKTVLKPLALLSALLFFTETTTAQQRLQIAQAQNQSALQDATQSEATSADNHQDPNASPFDVVKGKNGIPLAQISISNERDMESLEDLFQKTSILSPDAECGKGVEKYTIEKNYANLNNYIFANDFVLGPNERFILEEIEIIFLKDYNVNLDTLFFSFYEDTAGNGPGQEIPTDLTDVTLSIDNLGIYGGNTIKDIMLLTIVFNTPVIFESGPSGASFWGGTTITHQGYLNTSTAAVSTIIGPSQTFHVNNGNGWYKNTDFYQNEIPRDLMIGFYGQCEDNSPQYDYIYHDDTIKWNPNNPGDVSNPSGPTHTILVMEGTATFDENVEGLTLTVWEDANLNVEKVLKLNGNLTNDGHITFVNSSIDDTAQFAEFNHDILGDGLVTTERFIPAKRSFRFLTPTVNTTTTIRKNWQENGNNDPYWGTHITGNGGAANGFDPTGTNNPSMFTYSNDAAQTWNAVPNTNALTLNAGTPYRIMVRGDRTADLTNNDAVGNDTRLRATGKLVTGDFNVLDNNNNLTDGDYIFVANPYQAKVDLYKLLLSSSNVGEFFYYIWEPGLSSVNGRGAYTTFDFSTGEPITTGATATHQIQPGQAIFLVASGSNPSLLFKEEQKSTSGGFSTTFRSTTARIKMSLFYQESFDDNDTASDGIMIKFAEDGNNNVDQYDAHKLGNLDENLAVVNNDTRLSIESRDLPTHEEILPLFINNYRKTDYVLAGEFKFIPERTTAYLYDNYTDTYTEILTDGFEYRFSVDPAIEASISSKRFDVRFSVDPLLGIDDDQMTAVTVYPNPFSNDNFTIAAKGMEGQQLQVNIVNMLGQQIYNNTLTVSENGTVVVKLADAIASGVYHINIVSENQQSVSKKLIKN